MKLYLSTILTATAALAVCNALFFASFFGFSPLYGALMSVAAALTVFAIDAFVAVFTRFFPLKNYAPEKVFFREGKHELSIYRRLGIMRWKDKIPEVGKLLKKFDKTTVAQPQNPEYLYRFLCEMGCAEIMHFISLFAGFAAVFCFPLQFWFLFAMPAAAVNFFLQIPPILVQRYNRPRLFKLYRRAVEKKCQAQPIPANRPEIMEQD